MNPEIANNKRALHEYTILETIEVGVALQGTEVKSVRNGKINLRDAFARVENGRQSHHLAQARSDPCCRSNDS